MDDYMELGNSGLVAIENGWFLHVSSGNKIDPYGRVWNSKGEIIYTPGDVDDDE